MSFPFFLGGRGGSVGDGDRAVGAEKRFGKVEGERWRKEGVTSGFFKFYYY